MTAGAGFVAREKLLTCVHCGLCLASCPTYVESGMEADSPRGRIHLMRALEEGQLEPTAEVIRHLDLCLGCRACETACPSGVEYGALIEAARPYVERFRPAPARWRRRMLAAVLTRRSLRRALFTPMRFAAGTEGLARRLGSAWLAYAAAMGRRARPDPLPEVLEPAGAPRGAALLVTGCVAETVFPGTNVATARLLLRAGVRVLVPRGQGCCGALPMHLGDVGRARGLARALLAGAGGCEFDWIVTNAAGCGALLRGYGDVLADDAAGALAARARDALELLAELGLPAPTRELRMRVAVHDPCHLAHAQGVRTQVRALLAAIPGLQLVELEEADMCCGSAGTYNLTEPEMARRLLARKLDRIAASGAETVAAANPGCLVQLRAGAILRGLPLRVEHPIDLLAAAHRVQKVRD